MHLSTRAARVLLIGIAMAATATLPSVPHTPSSRALYEMDQYGWSSDSMQFPRSRRLTDNVPSASELVLSLTREPDRLVFNPLIVDNVM